jgi:hypothetical protein
MNQNHEKQNVNEMMAKIYRLVDPITGEIKYIGKTHTSLSERLRNHINGAKRSSSPTRKEKWILELREKNIMPIIELIKDVDKSTWRDEERKWIQYAKDVGWPILNLKRGGDGYDNITHSDEFKMKLSRKMKGNKYGLGFKWTPEQREKMMASRKEPWNKGKKGLYTKPDEFRKACSVWMSGEKHHQVKLSDARVIELRRRFNLGEKCADLHKEFGITYSHCVRLATNKTRQICVPS